LKRFKSALKKSGIVAAALSGYRATSGMLDLKRFDTKPASGGGFQLFEALQILYKKNETACLVVFCSMLYTFRLKFEALQLLNNKCGPSSKKSTTRF
jgi:hypothetical protein